MKATFHCRALRKLLVSGFSKCGLTFFHFQNFWPFSKSKFNQYEASTLLHRLVLSIQLGTVQTGTGFQLIKSQQHFMAFINYRKSKTKFKLSFNSHVYWDTLYYIY